MKIKGIYGIIIIVVYNLVKLIPSSNRTKKEQCKYLFIPKKKKKKRKKHKKENYNRKIELPAI